METNVDDFRIKSLARDRDAQILFGISLALVLLIVAGLAFLSDAQWDRLVNRSKILWAALLAAIPAIIAIWQRYQLRRTSAKALGQASTIGNVDVDTLPLLDNPLASNAPAEPASLADEALPHDTLAEGEELLDYSGDDA